MKFPPFSFLIVARSVYSLGENSKVVYSILYLLYLMIISYSFLY